MTTALTIQQRQASPIAARRYLRPTVRELSRGSAHRDAREQSPRPLALTPLPTLGPAHERRSASLANDIPALIGAARGGDERAWSRLVARLEHVPRAVARSMRLSSADTQDVVQGTWLALFTHIDRIHDPTALPGWLATTARREALRLLQRPLREDLTDDPDVANRVDALTPETEVLAREQQDVLARAIDSLPDRHRRLMTLLVDESAPDYEEISATLGVPRGSIGPIRARSLARLRRHPELHRLHCARG